MVIVAKYSFFSFRPVWRQLFLLLMLTFTCGPAVHAEGFNDPFHMESTNWMSFDRYKEEPSAWHASTPETLPPTPVVVPPPVVPPPPAEPVTLPNMPGLDAKHDIEVDTTLDDNKNWSEKGAAPLQLQNTSWRNAVQVARQDAAHTDDTQKPLNIRFSYLPHTPMDQTATDKQSVQQPPPVKSANDAEACAAVDAYKKRQLEAIESDRRTLSALQDAIAQLGLQKQLDFITKGGASASDSNIKIDYPLAK